MKRSKAILLALTIFGLLTLSAMNANAEATWYICSVNMAGPGYGATYVQLTDTATSPTFTRTWFILPASQSNAYLATALTAISSNMTVGIYVDLSTSPATLTSMYLNSGN